MSLAFTGGMVGWGSIASSSIIPSEIIGDYIQSLSTATASSESVTSDVSFRVGGAKEWSNAYIYLNTTSPEYERKYVGQTISDTSDLVGITIKKVRWRGQRYNGANGAIECGFSTRSAFCGNGTIQTSFGSITLSGSNAERNWDFTHSGSGYTIPNACTILVLKSSTNNGGFFKVPYAGANSNDFEDSSTFSSGGKGGASADAIDNDATCNVTCSQTHTRNVADLYLYYDLTEGGSYSIDSSTTNKWKSNSEATPTLTVDMGSAIDLTDLAIFPHSDTTVTTLGIEISTDNSTFTEMKEVETSDLTNGQWNFIGLSTGISARYVRIKSKDSSNAVLAINEVKVRNTDNSTYTPDMTSDTNWLDTVSARIDNNTSTGKIDFDVHRTDTNQALSYDLGTALSNTAWTLRYKMTVDTITQVSDANRMFMGMRSISASSNASTNSDFIGWHSKVGRTGGGVDFKEFHYMTTDGSSMDIEGTTSSVVPTTTTYYITITRKTATTWSLRISTSADYTGGTLHDDISCASGTQGLQYLWIGNVGVSGGSSARFMGTIEDVKIYNGVTTTTTDEKTTLADATVTTTATANVTDDLTTDKGWVSNTSDWSYNATNDTIDLATIRRSTTAQRIYIDLQDADYLGSGNNLSDTSWVIRLGKFKVNALASGSNVLAIVCLSDSLDDSGTNQDAVGFDYGLKSTELFIRLKVIDGVHFEGGGQSSAGFSSSTIPSTTTSYRWELSRNGNVYTMKAFAENDTTYSTPLETETVTKTGITGLRYLKIINDSEQSNSATADIEIFGAIKIYNGITAVSTTSSAAPPANTRYEEVDTRKIYRFTSSGTQSNTLGSDGDATNNGADLNTTDQKLGTGCLDFETGNGDYINATDLLTNNAMGSTGTISFWIKPESLNGAYMWSVGDSNGTSSRIYIEQQSTSLWTVFCQSAGSSMWKVDSTGVSFSTGTWYHVVITHDGGSSYGAVKLYINGVDRSSNSNNGTTWNKWVGDLSGLDNMAFGRHHHNNLVYTQKSDGLMDDMGVWNRALTQAEVTSLYNSGTGRTCNTIPSGLRAYYDCNSATVTNNTNAFTAWKERGSA